MAKVSSIEKNNKRQRMVKVYSPRREALKKIIMDKNTSPEDRFEATIKLSKLPRNSSKVRVKNRCEVTGRPRGYYRKFGISRIVLRDLAAIGQIPGLNKSSW